VQSKEILKRVTIPEAIDLEVAIECRNGARFTAFAGGRQSRVSKIDWMVSVLLDELDDTVEIPAGIPAKNFAARW
jgi:hypothetical protein